MQILLQRNMIGVIFLLCGMESDTHRGCYQLYFRVICKTKEMAFLLEPPQWLMMPADFLGNRKREAYPDFPRLPAYCFIPSYATTLIRMG